MHAHIPTHHQQAKKLLPFFDNAYQGYTSGSLSDDAYSVRLFASLGTSLPPPARPPACALSLLLLLLFPWVGAHPYPTDQPIGQAGLELFCACSFAKNMGLYGERIGALHAHTATPEEAQVVLSQFQAIIRPMYSSPPAHYAKVAGRILGDADGLMAEWSEELKGMAARIQRMRVLFLEALLVSAQVHKHTSTEAGGGSGEVSALGPGFFFVFTLFAWLTHPSIHTRTPIHPIFLTARAVPGVVGAPVAAERDVRLHWDLSASRAGAQERVLHLPPRQRPVRACY